MASTNLDKYCGSPFWNKTLSWNTDDPDLTICFERTVLIWVPCFFLWIFSSLEVYYIIQSKYKDIPWNILNISKTIVTALLVILSVVDFGVAIRFQHAEDVRMYNVDIYTPVLKILTFALSALLLIYNRKYGVRTSGLQFLFWLLIALGALPQFRTEIMEANKEEPNPYYFYISYLIYFPITCLMVILNCFADQPAKYSEFKKTSNPCPEEGASFLSRIFYYWYDSLAWKGFRKPLEVTDLWDVQNDNSCKGAVPRFEKYWLKTLRKAESNTDQQPRAAFKSDSGRVDFVGSSRKKQASILPAICKGFAGTFIFGAGLKLIQDLLTFVQPQILRLLIDFIEKDHEEWKGYFYVVLLFGTACIQTLVLSQYFQRMYLVGLRIRTALISTIYRKSLRLSNAARKESTVGEIVNLMAVDAQRFIELTNYVNLIWSAPLQIILSLYFLWDLLGPSVLAGLAVMIILVPINGVIANRSKTLQVKQMKNKDERVKLMNEILSGIKVLKLYAWEPSFEEQVLKIRNKEIKVLKQGAYLNAGSSFIWSCAPFLVSLVTFATYVLVDENNKLDPVKAFVSLSLFNILRFPLNMLPMMISNFVQTWVSVKRINKFMNATELDPNDVQHNPTEKHPVIIENGTFSWGEEPILKNINIEFEKRRLTAIVGSVGSGKSSLISAILGEMQRVSGRVNTVGSLAYVSQQAWIQNATLQDNITFGRFLSRRTYHNIIEACALKPDFDMLPAGDQTEIGEKGINLSGGQKQRVSLARAVYCNADIYLLDDPLSAVDSHVGKHIFDKVIGPNGVLQNSTRLLVTHGITYLPMVDKIIVLKDGEVSEVGTYQELLSKKGDFADFILQHINETSEEQPERLDELIDQFAGSVVSDEIAKKLTRARSRVSESAPDATPNGTLQRSKSVESDKSLKQHPSSVDLAKQDTPGNKLIEAEKSETGSVKWDVYKHYLKSIGIFFSVATVLFNLIFQGFSIGSNLWLTAWANNKNATDSERDLYLGVYGALGFAQALSILISSLTLFLAGINAAQKLHTYLLYKVLRASTNGFFDITPIGRILNRFSKDLDDIDIYLPQIIRMWLGCLLSVLSTIFVISLTTPIFITVIVPISIIYYLIQRFYVATSRQLKRLESVSRSPIYSHFGETVTGATTIRAYGDIDRFVKESETIIDNNQVCYFPSTIANRWLAVRLEMIGNFIILFAALFAVLDREQNPGLVGLSITYALQVTQTLNWLVRMTSDVETNIVAVERIKEYGETVQEAPWNIPGRDPDLSWPQTGTVEFKDFAVRYRPGLDLVLKGVTFTVKGGEKVGIVGRTGAGKSSLTLALFRIIESAHGEILIDGINIAGIGLHALRSCLTIIPQDAVLFSGSLRMNLDPFNKYTDDDLWRSLDHAHLKVFVKGLPAGLNHEVTEGGENLSVGQRQLICLSRALLRKTKVLVLDEATAAVDLETDDLIQHTIRTEFSDCTVLTIAHRLNTIMDSDRVIVLDKGYIVEFDAPSKLLQRKDSIFYGMAKDAGLV